MSTFETATTNGMLRALARTHFEQLDEVLKSLLSGLTIEQRVELSACTAELRRLLHGNEAPPASLEFPPNVHRLDTRRVVARGCEGPAFGARGGVEFAIGRGGLRAPKTEAGSSAAWIREGRDAPHIESPPGTDEFSANQDSRAEQPRRNQ